MANGVVVLSNWALGTIPNPNRFLDAPESRGPRLFATHPDPVKAAAGKILVVSDPVSRKGNLITTRSGTVYQLGTPDPEYEKRFPGALERLLKSIPEA